MEFEELKTKQIYLIDKDGSDSQYIEDSKKISDAIKQEIWNGEYSKPIYYYGISEKNPDIENFVKKDRIKVCRANNCLFPKKYTNTLVYDAKEKIIHWFVSVKNNELESI